MEIIGRNLSKLCVGSLGKCCFMAGTCGLTEVGYVSGSCYAGDSLSGSGSETRDGKCRPDNNE